MNEADFNRVVIAMVITIVMLLAALIFISASTQQASDCVPVSGVHLPNDHMSHVCGSEKL